MNAHAPHEPPRPEDAERRMEQLVGRVLQAGVLASALLVLAGAAFLLAQHGGAPADFRRFSGADEAFRSVHGSLRAALARDSRGLVQLGVILLVATPVARVALTLVAFAAQRDRIYVALTAIVLLVLLYGLLWSPV